MKIVEYKIRPIPRQAINGHMSIGIVEDDGKYYVIQVEPQIGISVPPVVNIIEYQKMKRSDDILDGDSNELITDEEVTAILKFATEEELLSEQRVEVAIRKAAAMSKSIRAPRFHHQYNCLMYEQKFVVWDMNGRKGPAPNKMVTTYDCFMCPKQFREPCISKLVKDYEEDVGKNRYVGDLESSPLADDKDPTS